MSAVLVAGIRQHRAGRPARGGEAEQHGAGVSAAGGEGEGAAG